jgi:hypothetical protein
MTLFKLNVFHGEAIFNQIKQTSGRTSDIDAVLHTYESVKQFVNAVVMDYAAAVLYTPVKRYNEIRYITVIYNLLFVATGHTWTQQSVQPPIVVSLCEFYSAKWAHTSKDMYAYVDSLTALNKDLPWHSNRSITVVRVCITT